MIEQTITTEELEESIRVLVPDESVLSNKLQQLIWQVVQLKPSFFVTDIEDKSDVSFIDLSEADCDEIDSAIKQQKKTKSWSTSYMLTTFYRHVGGVVTTDNEQSDTSADAWHFMSAYLQIMCLLAQRDDGHVNKIHQLGLRIRMALKRNSPQRAILDELIYIHWHVESMDEALELLQSYERDLKQQEMQGELNAAHLSSMVAQIRIAYEVILHDVQFSSRQHSQRQKTNNKHIRTNVITVDDETLRVKQFIHNAKVSNVHVNEIAVEQQNALLLDNNFEPTQSTAASAELQVWKTKQNHYHQTRNKLYLPSNSRYLSLYIYQQIFKEIWRNIHHPKSYKEKRAYAIIMLSILSGRSIHVVREELATEKSKRTWLAYDAQNDEGQTTGHYTVLNRIHTTKNRRQALQRFTHSQSDFFSLPLPDVLQAVIVNKFSVDDESMSDVIKQIKEKLNLPLFSKQHIDHCLFFIIKNELKQPLHAHLICGTDVNHHAPLYYTSIATSEVISTYEDAIEKLAGAFDGDEQGYAIADCLVEISGNDKKRYIGSNMALSRRSCQTFFEKLTSNLLYFNVKQDLDPISLKAHYLDQFNAYALWLWHVVQIQTGLRAVIDGPGVLNQFNFDKRLLWVSDKEGGQTHVAGRLIPLSDFLIQALQNYLAYLHKFSVAYSTLDQAETFQLDKILKSEQPLMQVHSKRPKGFIGVKPTMITRFLGNFLVHQDNWLRHQLRSMLTGRIHEDFICGLYGHEEDGQELMHPMSSFSMNSLHLITPHLDNIAAELGLVQVEVAI